MTDRPGAIELLESELHYGAFRRLVGNGDDKLYETFLAKELFSRTEPSEVILELLQSGESTGAWRIASSLRLSGGGANNKDEALPDLSGSKWSEVPQALIKAGYLDALRSLSRFSLTTEQYEALIKTVLSRVFEHPNEEADHVWRKRLLNDFLANLDVFPPSVLKIAGEKFHLSECLTDTQLLSADLYQAYLSNKLYELGGDRRAVYKALIVAESGTVTHHFAEMRSPPMPLTLALLDAGKFEQVADRLDRIEFTVPQGREIVRVFIDSGNQELLVTRSLHALPDSMLMPFEREHFLIAYRDGIGVPSFPIYQRFIELSSHRDELSRVSLQSEVQRAIHAILSPGETGPSESRCPTTRT